MMTYAKFLHIVVLSLLLFSLTPTILAAPPFQAGVACEQEVIVQADDWLSKIAEKV